MSHAVQDAISLEIAIKIAVGLPTHPEWLTLAKENLDRWSQRNSDSPGLLRCDDEWRRLLLLPVNEVVAILVAETDEGQRLRQNSPFTGILSAREVWEIKRRHHEASRT